ncbi:HAD-IA family hydrolase [uncultured Cyclobacterium sp.]|uniref:HAD family hydrolase n=1 Tax=uncultured Cyclobacterium sp. TaxID=453820 RepID=UPI0030EBD0AD
MELIFDLDNTIINSNAALTFREQRVWKSAYDQIPNFVPFGELIPIIQKLAVSHRVFIVSSSPASYIRRVCEFWQIPYSGIIAYHDTKKHKPHPEPFLTILERFNLSADNCISFGDQESDIVASKAARIISVGCLWGAGDIERLIESGPSYLLNTPGEIFDVISF